MGDTVLVRQPKKNKLSSKFRPTPYQVKQMKGTRVTVERKGHFITRNISHFKKLPDGVYDFVLQRNVNDDLFVDDNTPETVEEEEERQLQNRYPTRERQRIQRYGQNIFDP
eukprot:gene5832-6530_t